MSMHLAGLLKFSVNPIEIFDSREDKREERAQQWRDMAALASTMLEMYGVTERELVTA